MKAKRTATNEEFTAVIDKEANKVTLTSKDGCDVRYITIAEFEEHFKELTTTARKEKN